MLRPVIEAARRSQYVAASVGLVIGLVTVPALAQDDNNSCPVDGCVVVIASAEMENGEVRLTFESNFTPSMSKNHFHVWWGELWAVQQVTANAETWYEMEQGDWVPTDSYPVYVTDGVISVEKRDGATTLCVTAANRDHEILDAWLYDCRNVADLLE